MTLKRSASEEDGGQERQGTDYGAIAAETDIVAGVWRATSFRRRTRSPFFISFFMVISSH